MCLRKDTPFFFYFFIHAIYYVIGRCCDIINDIILVRETAGGDECKISVFFPAVFVPKSGRVWRQFLRTKTFAKYNDGFFFCGFRTSGLESDGRLSLNSKPLKKHACPRVLFFVLVFTLSCTDNNHIIASPYMYVYYIYYANKQTKLQKQWRWKYTLHT